jgi:peptidoglycan hydrolase-like protein with peptidoglycan-binding domain
MASAKAAADDIYGYGTTAAVKIFKSKAKLPTDSTVAP